MLAKAVEWGYLLESPARRVKRLRTDNRRTRILSPDEQRSLLDACPRKFRGVVLLALITGARIGELLALRWADCAGSFLTFWQTKNGKVRRMEITPSIQAVLDGLPKHSCWVFTNRRTQRRYTVNGARHVFDRAVERAGFSADVTLHTLRHTALSRMIAAGFDDYTVMEISGHSSTRMLAVHAPHS
jgi:integrase